MAQQLVALGWACFRPHPLLHYSPSLSAPCSPLLVECYRAMAHYASCHLFSHNGHFGCSIMPPTAAQWARLRSPFRQWQLAKIALLSGSWSAAAPSLSLPIFTLYDCHNFGYFSRHSLRLPLCGYQCVLLPLQPRIVLHCLHCSNLWSRRPVLVHFHLRVKVLRLKYANVARAKRDLFAMQTGDWCCSWGDWGCTDCVLLGVQRV